MESLFEKVYIAQAVKRELMAKVGADVGEIENGLKKFIEVKEAGAIPKEYEYHLEELGAGERESIKLVYSYKSTSVLLIDDKAGRRAARGLNLAVTGTIGVLIIAKNKKLVKSVSSTLEEMKGKGYWLSDEIVDAARRIAGERN
ncbi:MAG: DUF3368 domain-containing protein [Bacteroidota bacterium]|nr:DUF3368 domain-containing protein [Bacteroidota bacterium]